MEQFVTDIEKSRELRRAGILLDPKNCFVWDHKDLLFFREMHPDVLDRYRDDNDFVRAVGIGELGVLLSDMLKKYAYIKRTCLTTQDGTFDLQTFENRMKTLHSNLDNCNFRFTHQEDAYEMIVPNGALEARDRAKAVISFHRFVNKY